MAAFTPKNYQSAVLESVELYFRNCRKLGNANTAFYQTTLELWNRGSPYNSIEGFAEDMPYFCLRVPTGGGKTWLASKAVSAINTHLLSIEHSVILWLVPSNAIREQTLRALKDRHHPYHLALREAGPITVLDLDEAKAVTRATLDTSTTVIVTTRQAFQVGNTEIRKVYESSGALMHHFDALHPDQRAQLEKEDGVVPYSLANVLRLRRPFVIVDEAHNSRTELSFETLSRFNPSGIMELTATPDMERTPSNVLHSVFAAELKGEEMIKLPIRLETEPDWQRCLADAIARREELQVIADSERRQGAAYLRPIALVQAQPRSKVKETLDVDRVRKELITNHQVPEAEIVVATGEEKGLESLDTDYAGGILSEQCPVKYVITQQALAEGWDCPFAYVLVSMAEVHSSTAVEQLLGRILRQPGAKHRDHGELNRSYAFVVSRDFNATAEGLRDRLVQGAGFNRREALDFVSAAKPEQGYLDYRNPVHRADVRPVAVELTETPEIKNIPKTTRDKLTWDKKTNTLTINEPLSPEEVEDIKATVSEPASIAVIEAAAKESRTTAVEFFQTPAELGIPFEVPQLGDCLAAGIDHHDLVRLVANVIRDEVLRRGRSGPPTMAARVNGCSNRPRRSNSPAGGSVRPWTSAVSPAPAAAIPASSPAGSGTQSSSVKAITSASAARQPRLRAAAGPRRSPAAMYRMLGVACGAPALARKATVSLASSEGALSTTMIS